MPAWPLLAVLGSYVLGLAVLAPATIMDAYLQRASDGRMRLAQAAGTIWFGRGEFEIRNPGTQRGAGTAVAWRILPASLFGGRARYEVVPGGGARPFLLEISPSGIECTGLALSLPATILGLAAPNLSALRLSGELEVGAAHLAFGRAGPRGSATLRWRSAGSALVPVAPLGDYELRAIGDGNTIRATLRTLHGPLELHGEGSWTRGRAPVVRATARVAPQHREQLAPFLRLIAVERGEGHFELAPGFSELRPARHASPEKTVRRVIE